MQVGTLHKNTRRTHAGDEAPLPGPIVLECPVATPVAIEDESRVVTALNHALDKAGHLPLRRLRLEIHDRRIVVRGTVPTYYLKQLAQCIIREIAPDCEIMNLVEVVGSACPGLLCTAIRRGRNSKSI